jgi:hypothetical protein
MFQMMNCQQCTVMTQKNDTIQQDKPLVNRVAKSGLITFVLEDLGPESEIVEFDISRFLWKGLVVKEKEYRAALKEEDWSAYDQQIVCIACNADAIVPSWAYMLVASHLQPVADRVWLGSKEEFLANWFSEKINELDLSKFEDARVVVKGCARENVPESAYVQLVMKLQSVVRSLMYGEPCSTVPVYKRRKL